ncbi:hypothetical protein DESUT3_18100 [Desulfuromonas versatilis]|uniref:Methanethiol S-methyltransferase n=1 Tax=Desulfuromonas versatilis TaxID=2802975 RepID=A0ABM8HS19_9BACT|nr:hypothetical protein [Desulfuromonas versatilis]BCR04741.1 hypothetical protein DESUT3_18100 [Desulfuromonas versatilis]
MFIDLLILAVLWLGWCLLHSLLITPRADGLFHRLLGQRIAWFRLGYNLFAIISFLPPALWMLALPYPEFLVWRWPWTFVKALFWGVAGWLLYEGFRVYPLREFLGLDQVGRFRRGEAEAPPAPLLRDGILARVRHPWYAAVIILLWARDISPQDLVTSALLTGYLLVGVRLEEAKLVAAYGEEYRRYQRQAPRLIPRTPLSGRLKGFRGPDRP